MTGAQILAYTSRCKLVTPEHLLLEALNDGPVVHVLSHVAAVPVDEVKQKLRERIGGMEKLSDDDTDEEMMAS